jgi:hypothetical protein
LLYNISNSKLQKKNIFQKLTVHAVNSIEITHPRLCAYTVTLPWKRALTEAFALLSLILLADGPSGPLRPITAGHADCNNKHGP